MIQPAPVHVAQADIDDLRARLGRTRWPRREPVPDHSQGARLADVRALCEHWRTAYDWRRCEAMLNAWNPQRTAIDGVDVHFFHVRSPEPGALPLVMTHGWPGSVVEFHKVVGPLTDPRAHGGDAADAVHLVLPSLPGFGFSGAPADTGWGPSRIAAAWITLMVRLGYGDDWAAQGGDWGGEVTAAIGSLDPAGLRGLHLNTVQETRPQTVGFALADSPAGLAAWISEKFHDWTDPASVLTPDEVLDDISIYWFTNTGASSARLYWEDRRDDVRSRPVEVPTAFSMFRHDVEGPSRTRAAERFTRIVRWSEVEQGGHFAAFEQPELFVDEVRAGLRALR
jgi:epoxide hydrolase